MNLKKVSLLFSLLALLNVSCASRIHKADISPTAQPSVEIDRLEKTIETAQAQQVDVLSPTYFRAAKDYLAEAKNDLSTGAKGAKILEDIAYSQGALDQAIDVASKGEPLFPEVIKARRQAQLAQANKYKPEEMMAADKYLQSVSREFENSRFSVNPNDRTNLQKDFLDIELHAVLAARLANAKNIFELAKRNGAESETPKSFNEMGVKIKEAELKITTALHDTATLDAIENDLNGYADHLIQVLHEVKKARNESVENLAIENVRQKNRLENVTENLAESHRDLNQVEQFDKIFEKARQKFSAAEAEVFRDGDKLIIRLKGLQFPSGRADLTATSVSLLKKVSDVIAEMPTSKKVIVEGHADGLGSQALNTRLSEDRAKTVVSYLVSENAVNEDKISSEGSSYEKPLASNKSKQGRAANRRVDLIITP